MSLIPDRHLTMNVFPALRVCVAASLLIGSAPIAAVQAQANDMFPTKAAAERRARELKCTGAFAMGKEWMPCKDFATYEKAVSKES
ncbi:MAG: DUF3721 domain-containing protein [Synechococcaceae cyanobacterium]|nr:DUF3721 domain-containing protein [Synechococcaceae cyanobacterium]